MGSTRANVSKSGQVSIRAAVRGRWSTDEVVVIDRGDRVIVLPVLPLDELVGRYADRPGPTTDALRDQERPVEEASLERIATADEAPASVAMDHGVDLH